MGMGTWLMSLALVAIAGFTRGFSGFGSAMILAPSLSLLVHPQEAIAAIILLEMTAGAGLLPEASKTAQWKAVLPLVLSAAVTVLAGAYLLTHLDPVLIRRCIGGLLLFFVLLLMSGKTYHPHPSLALTCGVGALSGFLTGLASMGGPPVVLFEMSGDNTAAANRANFIVFFALTQAIASISYFASGILTVAVWRLFAAWVPVYVVGLLLGRFYFKRVDELLFRQFVLGLLMLVAWLALIA